MDLHMIKSRTFQKVVLSYTAILIIPIFIFFYISIQKMIDENYNKLISMHNTDTQSIVTTIDAKLIELMHIGDNLYHSKWIKKFMADFDSFDNEFDVVRKLEINQELNNYVALTGFLSNISVIFPYKNSVVSQNGWCEIDNYFSDVIKLEQEDIKNIIFNVSNYDYFRVIGHIKTTVKNNTENNMLIFRSLELNRRPRAVLLFFINKEDLRSYINKITFPSLKNLTIINNGVEIFNEDFGQDYNEETGELLTVTEISNVTSWEFICTYNNDNLPINVEQLFPLYTGVALSLVAGFMMALILGVISYKPLYYLFNNIFKHKEEKCVKGTKKAFYEYEMIETSFDDLIDQNKQILHRMESYESAAKSNLLIRLLKGYFDNTRLNEQINQTGILYSNDHYFCVILINMLYTTDSSNDIFVRKQGVVKSLIIVENIIDDYNIDYEIIDVLDDTFALILNFDKRDKNIKTLEEVFLQIKSYIEKSCDIEIIMAKGNVEKGIIGISKSYQIARDNLEYAMFEINKSLDSKGVLNGELYYYPTDWQIQLINNLKIGDLTTVTRIIDEVKLENGRRYLSKHTIVRLISVIAETQLRVLDELNIDTNIYKQDFEKIIVSGDIDKAWEKIYKFSNFICYRSQYANSTSNFELANSIIKYIDDNYNNPDLSLKKLAEVFNMTEPSLSKLFKEVTGIKYYTYLSHIRIEKAKVLLKDTDKKIGLIANEVGYENEYSFRRAFKRYEGITPSDYSQKAK